LRRFDVGVFSRLEGGLDSAFDRAAGAVFRAPVEPAQIAKRAEKQMNREKLVGAGKQYAPTLYTVLVNTNDNRKLFGFYPTMAAEIETYLLGKGTQNGLKFDGRPLVRFIVDDQLKSGRFEVIAENVAAPIIAQLRDEEMEFYGLKEPAAGPGVARGTDRAGIAGASAVLPMGGAERRGAAGVAGSAGAAGGGTVGAERHGAAGSAGAAGGGASRTPPPTRAASASDVLEAALNAVGAGSAGSAGAAVGVAGAAAGAGVAGAASAAAAAASAAAGAGAAASEMDAAFRPTGLPSLQGSPRDAQGDPFDEALRSLSPAPVASKARLTNHGAGKTYALTSPTVTLGRDASCDIVIDDANVSRKHASLAQDVIGTWKLVDLDSTNGTLLNGNPIITALLRDGDQITLGITVLEFREN
jgi:hypothetical protein